MQLYINYDKIKKYYNLTTKQMEATSHEVMANNWEKNTYFIISLILFIAIICVSALLWTMNSSLTKQITNANTKIAEYNKQIDELKADNEIAAFDIINANKVSIVKNIEKSQAQNYITEVLALWKKYKMMFTGFSYNWESINTTATYNNKDPKDDAIAWVSTFIKDFRTTKHSMFWLSPIASVAGDVMKRTFEVTFELIK